MVKVKSIQAVFRSINDFWKPITIANIDTVSIKLAKFKGEFKWHHHEREDELFVVMKGNLKILLKNKTLLLKEGDFVTIPRGIEHKPVAGGEVHVMLVEPASTIRTGNIKITS
ncbi:MAG: cupin domain-containing protein [Candidatus Hodarchaeales archaeon]